MPQPAFRFSCHCTGSVIPAVVMCIKVQHLCTVYGSRLVYRQVEADTFMGLLISTFEVQIYNENFKMKAISIHLKLPERGPRGGNMFTNMSFFGFIFMS